MGQTCQKLWSQLSGRALKKIRSPLASKQSKAPKQQGLWIDTIEIGPTPDSGSIYLIAATIGNSASLWVWAKVNSHAAWLFINSSSSVNHILPQFIAEHRISLQKMKQLYGLNIFERMPMTYNNRQVTHHTQSVGLQLRHH